MGDSIIGSLATNSRWNPLGTWKVFNSSSGESGLGGGSSNFTLASAGPALFLLMAQVTGKLRAKPSVSRKRRKGRLIETKTLIRSVEAGIISG